MPRNRNRTRDRYSDPLVEDAAGNIVERNDHHGPSTNYARGGGGDDADDDENQRGDGIFRDRPRGNYSGGDDSTDDSGISDKVLSVSELLYSSSSYYAIAKPGKLHIFIYYSMFVFVWERGRGRDFLVEEQNR